MDNQELEQQAAENVRIADAHRVPSFRAGILRLIVLTQEEPMISRTPSILAFALAGAVFSSTSASAQTSSCGTMLPCLRVNNTNSPGGEAIMGTNNSSDAAIAVTGEALGSSGTGVGGTSVTYRGVWGSLTTATSPSLDVDLPAAVVGESRLTGTQFGVLGVVPGNSSGVAVYGDAQNGGSAWAGYFNGIVGASNSIFTDQNVYAMGVLLTSDARLKTDVVDSKTGLTELLRLRPVDFSWKTNSADQARHTGLIAQEVQKVIPQLVQTRKSPPRHTAPELRDTLAVDYIGLVPVMIKAIQEQQQIIRQQGSRIASLEQSQKALAAALTHKTMATVVPVTNASPASEGPSATPIAAR